MERLKGAELATACKVLHERYERCMKTALTKDVVALDFAAPTKKCGPLFADLSEYCVEAMPAIAAKRVAKSE